MDPLTLAIAAGITYAVSGGARKASAQERFKAAYSLYESHQEKLATVEELKARVVDKLGNLASRGVKNIAVAQRMLSPLEAKWFRNSIRIDSRQQQTMTLALRRSEELSLGFYAATSVATGVATAGALWFGTQAIGIASTGMPILFLHGAALHNASLAFLGGGSLASGGGGMLAGGAALAAAAVIPASVMFGWKSHSKANELNKASDELDEANKHNSDLLATTSRLTSRLSEGEAELKLDTEEFERVVEAVNSRLLPFRWFSHLFRLIRARWWGTYYLSNEMQYVEELSTATVLYTTQINELKEKFSRA